MPSKILFKWMLSFMNTLFHFKYSNIKVYIYINFLNFYELYTQIIQYNHFTEC